MARKRTAVLISGRGSNMACLIEAAHATDYPAEISLVISNRPDALGLDRASAAGIATQIIDHTRFNKDRAAFDAALDEALRARKIELVCLAGFMRLLTPEFVGKWANRMINVHPALLPAFKGLDTHRRVLEAGAKMSGASVHFVAPDMDSGPIIAQAPVPVLDGDTEETLAARVLAAEHQIFPMALRLLAEGKLRIANGRCEIVGARWPKGELHLPTIVQG